MNKYIRMVDRIERAEEIQRYTENRCDTLEKGNAELKEANAQWEQRSETLKDALEHARKIYGDDLEKSYKENAKFKDQLTKAKELLAKWVELFKPKGGNIPPTPIQVETEQFLKEIE